MEGNDGGDDFDDFFDTPGRSSRDFSDKEKENEKVSPRNSPNSNLKRAASKTRDRNDSGLVDAQSVSSDSQTSPDYSSDSESDSSSASQNSRRRRSRSRTSSSGSGDSCSSRKRRKDRKNSRSASSSGSRSRSFSPDNQQRDRRSYQKDRRRDSSSSLTSSTQTDDEKSGRRSPSPRQPKRHAWTSDGGDRVASRQQQDRPKTAKRRPTNGEDRKGRHAKHRSYSPVESDSDMTDVSPISSPRNGSVNGHKRDSASSGSKYGHSKPMFEAIPLERDGAQRDVQDGGDRNALDLNILMKAVSELEKQKRVKANTRRVMFEPSRPRPMDKSNYTFSNDDTHRIEAENKRLLREIVRQMHAKERSDAMKGPEMKVKQATLTASAVNRRRDQSRIENENMAFLKRLQKIKPTKGISRREQLHAYNSTVLHGIPIATLHPTSSRASSRTGRMSSASSVVGSMGSRTRSLTSIHSSVTASSVGTASRMSSRASSRPSSGKRSVTERPPWDDRWCATTD